jgi:serine/threonine protein phosphatase PrpC
MLQKNLFLSISVFWSAVPCLGVSLETMLSDFVQAQSRLIGSLTVGIASEQGMRAALEDAHSVFIGDGYGWYAVFDGHGGAEVAQFAADAMHTIASDAIIQKSLDFKRLFELFNQYLESKNLVYKKPTRAQEQGSTAVIALIQDGMLTVANLGDSRAVLCRRGKAVRITTDHKPTDPSEQQRIAEKKDPYCELKKDDVGTLRIFSKKSGSALAVSRALGDKTFHPCISYSPDVFTRKIASDDQFLVLACDGLWDVLSDQQVVDFVLGLSGMGLRNPQLLAQQLVDFALEQGSTDNVSVILVMFPPFPG